MKDQKRTWSRRQFLNSGIAGIAGMMIIPKLASSSRSRVVADIKLGFIGMGAAIDVFAQRFSSDTRSKKLLLVAMYMALKENVLRKGHGILYKSRKGIKN